MLTYLSLETYRIPSKQTCGNTLVVLWSNTIDATAIFTAWLQGFSLMNSSKQKGKKKKKDPFEMQFISALYSKLPLACTMGRILQVVSHLCSTVKSEQNPWLLFFLECVRISLQMSDFHIRTTLVLADIFKSWTKWALCSRVNATQTAGTQPRAHMSSYLSNRPAVSLYCNKTCRGMAGHTAVCVLTVFVLSSPITQRVYMQAEAPVVFLFALIPSSKYAHILYSTAH